MPNKKPISKYLGIGRGSFRKAFVSVLLDKYSEEDAFEVSKKELGLQCVYCGIENDKQLLQPDYLWAQSEGGLFKKGNVVPACPTCNSNRGSKPWMDFINQNKMIDKSDKDMKIKKIKVFMKKYGMEIKPNRDDYINKQQAIILDDLNILLDALTQGLRAKVDNPQQKKVKFHDPKDMFDELVLVAEKYLIN